MKNTQHQTRCQSYADPASALKTEPTAAIQYTTNRLAITQPKHRTVKPVLATDLVAEFGHWGGDAA